MTDALPIGQSNQLMQMEMGQPAPSLSAEQVRLRIARFTEQQKMDPAQPATCICECCCEPFDYRPRSQWAQERLHQTLFMTGPAVNHVHRICNGCFENIVGPALRNERVEMVGVANHRQSNLALAQLGK